MGKGGLGGGAGDERAPTPSSPARLHTVGASAGWQ